MTACTHSFGRQLDIRLCSPQEVAAAVHPYTHPFGRQGLESVGERDTVPEAGVGAGVEAQAQALELANTVREAVREAALGGWGHIRPSHGLPPNSSPSFSIHGAAAGRAYRSSSCNHTSRSPRSA